MEVAGLKAAKENFNKLNEDLQRKLARDGLRELGWQLAKPMRAATYTTFKRQTGAIQSGLSVSIWRESKTNQLAGYVLEYPQYVGAFSPMGALFQKHHRTKTNRRKKASAAQRAGLVGVAYWWRFLEIGTHARKAARTPGVLLGKRAARPGTVNAKRQARAMKDYVAAPSRGALASRSWLRPAYLGHVHGSIQTFRDVILKLIDAAVSDMPKQ